MDSIQIPVTLSCCGARHEVHFDRQANPELPPGHFQAELECSRCSTTMLLNLKITTEEASIEQTRA